MSVYYVTHPNLGVSAVVHAPATEKARTTFLDFMERQGRISRADRHYWRRNMVAERLEYPEDIQSDIELHYGYEETQQPPLIDPSKYQAVSEEQIEFDPEAMGHLIGSPGTEYRKDTSGWTEPEGQEVFEERPQQPSQQDIGEVSRAAPKGLSPIAKVSLGQGLED